MESLMKILTGVLGAITVIVCLITIGVVGYSMTGAGSRDIQTAESENTIEKVQNQPEEEAVPTATPESVGEDDGEIKIQPVSLSGHTHDYRESVVQKATCYQAGKLKYTCSVCGDIYYLDTSSTGHVPDDWEISRKATADREGIRVKKCIYCDEIVAQESVPYTNSNNSGEAAHVHEYRSNVEREPTCVFSGLRKYTCSCGSFYTEQIPARGHIATDWTEAEAASSTAQGREQITCTVCGVVLNSRAVPAVTESPSPSPSSTPTPSAASASPSASVSPQTTATPTPTPTATPHSHDFKSYVLKESNCSEKGIRSFVCDCGRTYAEEIDLDPNRHNYVATVVRPTETANGYTLYWCTRCNNTYMDNYTPALNNR